MKFKKNYQDILKKLNQQKKIDLVMVDFFDTIVTRTVHPEYVKYLSSKKICDKFQILLKPEDFYLLRNRLEIDLCLKNQKDGFDLEFSILSLFDLLYIRINEGNNFYRVMDKNIFVTECLEIEKLVELSVQKLDSEIIDILKKIKSDKIIVSDFYFSEKIFQVLLDHHKLDNHFKNLYVSSDYLLTKKSGRLYKKILEEFELNPVNCFMIGDNKISDYQMPTILGINSFNIKRKKQMTFYRQHLVDSANLGRFKKKLINKCNNIIKNDNILFKEMGLVLYLFIERLYNSLLKDGVEDVLFFSKEGYFLKELFDVFQDFKKPFNRISSHYFYVSRKSTFLPSLNKLENENFNNLFRQYNTISPTEFLKSLNFKKDEIDLLDAIIKNVDFDVKIINFSESYQFKIILSNEKFKNLYENNRITQRDSFLKYVKTILIDDKINKFAVCDVGWKGTIQDNISKILYESSIKGYYFGLITHDKEIDLSDKHGLFFEDTYENNSESADLFTEFISIYEVLLGAPNPSTGYYSEDGPVLDDDSSDSDFYINTILPLQQQLKKIFLDFNNLMSKTHFIADDFSEIFYDKLCRLIYFPSRNEMSFFDNIKHYENFGLFEHTKFENKIIKNKYLSNIYQKILFILKPKQKLAGILWKSKHLRSEFGFFIGYLYYFYKKRRSRKRNILK